RLESGGPGRTHGPPLDLDGALQLPRPADPPDDPGPDRDHGDHVLPAAADPRRPGAADPRPALHAEVRRRAPPPARPRRAALGPVRPLREAARARRPRQLDQLPAAGANRDLPAPAR